MRPTTVPPPYSQPVSEPNSSILTIAWVKWFQYFFFIDPLWRIVTSVAAAYTLLLNDEFVLVDTSGGAVTVKFPASLGDVWDAKLNRSKMYIIKATGANNVTMNGNGQNIDGAATYTILGHSIAMFINDGTQWYAMPPTINTAGFLYDETPTGAVNGANVTFTLTGTPATGTLKLWLSGQLQKSGTDYTLVGNVATMAIPPFVGQWLFASYRTI